MGDSIPGLPCPTSESQVLLCGQSGRAALLDRSQTLSRWLCQHQKPLEPLCRAKVLVPCHRRHPGTACALWHTALHSPEILPGPADRKGFSKEKQDRKDQVIPRKKHQHIPPGKQLRDGRQRRSPRPTRTMCGNFSSALQQGYDHGGAGSQPCQEFGALLHSAACTRCPQLRGAP